MEKKILSMKREAVFKGAEKAQKLRIICKSSVSLVYMNYKKQH